MSKWVEYAVVIVASFTIPTLTMASQWGGFGEILQRVEQKVDKIDDRTLDTLQRVSRLEGSLESK